MVNFLFYSTIIPHKKPFVKEKMHLSEKKCIFFYTANDSPQPQDAVALGFITLR